MDIQARLVEKTSKEGNKYICVEIPINSSYTITLFPSKAEVELLKFVLSTKKA